MHIPRKDALLRTTRFALWVALILAAATGAALLLLIPAIWAFSGPVLAKAAERGIALSGNEALMAFSAFALWMAVMVGLAVQFLRKLIAVIDSVGLGSPFIPQNAARLRHMGWIVLAMQAMALLATPGMVWLRHVLPRESFSLSISLEGLITALLLFVLARVFDHGTQLEQDVEGTV